MKASEVKVNAAQLDALQTLSTDGWTIEPHIHSRTLSALESRSLIKVKTDKAGTRSVRLMKLGEKVLAQRN